MSAPSGTSRGTVLAMVLVVVAILAVVTASEMFLIRAELGAHAAFQRGQQARAAAMSGVHRAISVLSRYRQQPEVWRDSPELFHAQPVTGEDQEPWFFTVYADNLAEPDGVRFGPEDEASKINVNLASAEILGALPGMTDERVDCLLDFRDPDSNPRPNGAEQDYYDALPRPYRISNFWLRTLEELLLVKGFDGTIVFGEDANRNGTMERNEDDRDESFPPDDGDGRLNRGLRALATAISMEPDVDNEGNPRINLNAGDPETVRQEMIAAGLDQEVADFVAEARKAKHTFTDPSELLGMTLEVPDPKLPGKKKQIASGVDESNLAEVVDRLTTNRFQVQGQACLLGRVNLSTAPKEVLSALPQMSDTTAREIVDARGGLDAETRSTIAWIYTRNVVSAETFKKWAPLLTARSYQFRVKSFGYSPTCGRFCVLEAVIDLAWGEPRIPYLRELTRLGMPMAPLTTEP